MYQPEYPLSNPGPRQEKTDAWRAQMKLLDQSQWHFVQKRYRLSPRELEVARLVCHGLDNGQIAKALKIKHGTVKTHIRNVYRRIRVRNKISMLLKFLTEAGKLTVTSGPVAPVPIADNPAADKKKNPASFSLQQEE